MAIYAIAIRPLIDKIQNEAMQCWYADDAAAAGRLPSLKEWWDKLVTLGPHFGYYPNARKSIIVKKTEHFEVASEIFRDYITTEGTKYLGTPIGSEGFAKQFVETQVAQRTDEIQQLFIIAKSESQADYAAFTQSVTSEWTFFLRTEPLTQDQLAPLEDAIRYSFIPCISGSIALNDKERILLSLPTRLGGLGIINPKH